MKMLNRIVRYVEEGIEYEADPRHAELVVKMMKMEEANGVMTPGEKTEEEEEGEAMTGEAATEYRAICARCNYLALDRMDIAYAAKECCRRMAAPTVRDWNRLKRMTRYLKARPRLVQKFGWQEWREDVRVDGDTDFAGCTTSRKSTTGGAVQWGDFTLKFWSKTQSGICLSSGEAELVGMVRAASEGLGVMALMADLGIATRGDGGNRQQRSAGHRQPGWLGGRSDT